MAGRGQPDREPPPNSLPLTWIETGSPDQVDAQTTAHVDYSVKLSTPSGMKPAIVNKTFGAEVSIPYKNVSFYFSGMVSASGGPLGLFVSSDSDPQHVSHPSNDLLMCNTSTAAALECQTLDLPDFVAARAEAELLWLPYGVAGILVVIGGVIVPGDMFLTLPDNATTRANTNANFTTQISIFDIDAQKWYNAQTSGDQAPGQVAAFCAVVAAAQDASSHNIYIYGGYDGTYITNPAAFDEVWVLSIPAFVWTRVQGGTTIHRRQSHKCIQPYANQMFTIGGTIELGSYLESPAFDVFDLNELTWKGSYDPLVYDDYLVPPIISQSIGGHATGGATRVAEGLDPELAALLKVAYQGPTRTATPYKTLSPIEGARKAFEGLVGWLVLVIAILAYLVFASLAVVAIVVTRRRMFYQRIDMATPEIESKRWVVKWMHNALPTDKQRSPPQGAEKKEQTGFKPLRLAYIDNPDDGTTPNEVTSISTDTSLRDSELTLFDDNNAIEMRSFLNLSDARTS